MNIIIENENEWNKWKCQDLLNVYEFALLAESWKLPKPSLNKKSEIYIMLNCRKITNTLNISKDTLTNTSNSNLNVKFNEKWVLKQEHIMKDLNYYNNEFLLYNHIDNYCLHIVIVVI